MGDGAGEQEAHLQVVYEAPGGDIRIEVKGGVPQLEGIGKVGRGPDGGALAAWLQHPLLLLQVTLTGLGQIHVLLGTVGGAPK